MELPSWHASLRDEENDVLYTVYAYRSLTEAELRQAVRFYLSRRKKKPQPSTRVKIVTTIGASE